MSVPAAAALILGDNGPVEDGEKVLAPARRVGRPVADRVGPLPYRARQMMLDEPNATHGLHRYWRSAFTEQISDRMIDVLVENAASFTSPLSALIFFYMHGAATRVPPTETAFAARRPQWDFDAIGQWMDGAQSAEHIAWVRALWSQLEPHLEGSAYVNHLAEDDRPEKVRASFGENYGRLRQLKAVRSICHVPLIASGGAGAPEHFVAVFVDANVDGALAASVFHTGAIGIGELKRYLSGTHVEMRA